MRVNWLRDVEELDAYTATDSIVREVVLLIRTEGHGINAVMTLRIAPYKKDYHTILGWMPVDCDHYNQWKAEREQICPECDGMGEICDHFNCCYTCLICNGTGTIDKKED